MDKGNLPLAPNRQAAPHNPHNLPTKVCAHCGRPFTWRKKWARDWNCVKYCSDKCRAAARKPRP